MAIALLRKISLVCRQIMAAFCSLGAAVSEDRILDTYVICSTPRTGSTLLCELLASTGVAGNPHSYFRSQDIDRWASEWGLQQGWRFDSYIDAVRRFTATPNGVLGLRIMWGTLDEVLYELRSLRNDESDLTVLEAAFGSLRYIHLSREDVVGQAISLFRAEESNYWHSTQPGLPRRSVQYDYDEIAKRVESLEKDDRAWVEWFESLGIEPLSVSYEALDLHPRATTEEVLGYLGLEHIGEVSAPNKKLADETTEIWRDKFLLEASAT